MKEPGFITRNTKNLLRIKREMFFLLQKLIATPSFSKEEDETCGLLEKFLDENGVLINKKKNNIWCANKYFDPVKPSILLNSHHDTVKPNAGYTNNPFQPIVMDGKLFGLGSNDAGGSLVSLLAAFLHFYEFKDLKYNLVFAATAEEEISGINGIAGIINDLPEIDFAIVGEPTQMQLAIAERGLMVLDCKVTGQAGHAARNEGENAITKAMNYINWFNTFKFPKSSEWLGDVKMSVTIIKAGEQHNVVPAVCEFTVDVRTTDVYSNEEVLKIIKQNIPCEINARSMRLQPSTISINHPFVVEGMRSGRKIFGSPTMSDQALMPWPSLKMGPGDSARSHSANEFIYLHEIEEGIDLYIKILKEII